MNRVHRFTDAAKFRQLANRCACCEVLERGSLTDEVAYAVELKRTPTQRTAKSARTMILSKIMEVYGQKLNANSGADVISRKATTGSVSVNN